MSSNEEQTTLEDSKNENGINEKSEEKTEEERIPIQSKFIQDLKEDPDLFDLGREGPINPAELKVALESLGYDNDPESILALIKELDPNNTGNVDFEKMFDMIHSKMQSKDINDQISTAFKMMDIDRTGKITFENLKHVSEALGENISELELKEMINEADDDNDGEISFEEFMMIVNSSLY